MKAAWKYLLTVLKMTVGCALFSLGFNLFLVPNGMNAGGISGLALIFVELAGIGSVGTLSNTGGSKGTVQ